MKLTARLAQKLGVKTVVGFTGSSIWQYVAMFPPVSQDVIDTGFQDFADRWNPILDVFDECGVRFAHEVHPSEIAYDYWSTHRAHMGGGRNGILSSHLPWGDTRHGWDLVSTGRGDVPWEDAGMDWLRGAPEALAFLKRFDFAPPTASFDAAFKQ